MTNHLETIVAKQRNAAINASYARWDMTRVWQIGNDEAASSSFVATAIAYQERSAEWARGARRAMGME